MQKLTHVNSSKNISPEVTLLTEDDWVRYREIRLRALQSDGDAFGGDLASESEFTENQWREKARKYVGLIASIENKDCGFMTIENLTGDFGASCWVGSCWVDSTFRNSGVLRALFTFSDHMSAERNWGVQGLGVWIDNSGAIAAYEKIGFERMGEPQESTRKPGLYYQRMIRSVK